MSAETMVFIAIVTLLAIAAALIAMLVISFNELD